MKRMLVVLWWICVGSSLVEAQYQEKAPYWYSLEQGKLLFRSGNYGNALLAFEDARRDRAAMYTKMEQAMIDLLSINEVRRLGDSLALIEPYIAERKHLDAAAALQEVYYRIPKESLGDSAYKALDELGKLKAFPEAEYWIGEVYRIEGELDAALTQYFKAHEQRAFLSNPEFDMDILYRILDMFKMKRQYAGMAEYAQKILATWDPRWSGTQAASVKSAMSRILENDGITRFLTLYRYNNTKTERAHRLLGLYYYGLGKFKPAAEHLMFAFLIQNTVLIDELLRHRFNFSFTSFDDLLAQALKQYELAEYIDETDYYKTLYYFGAASYSDGKPVPARQLWQSLANRPDADEWAGRSRRQLGGPFVEQSMEMP